MSPYHQLIALIDKGVDQGVFPGAALLVSHKGKIIFHEGTGHTSLADQPSPVNEQTLFDLASLTKPLATSLAFMKLVDMGRLHLDQPLSELLPDRSLGEKENITPRLLLCHSAGFEDWQPFYLQLEKFEPQKRKQILRDKLLELPLLYTPGGKDLYSDLGFMMLEWIIEISSKQSLNQFIQDTIYKPLFLNNLFFIKANKPLTFNREMIAATENCPWRKRTIQGEVHDENAYALGGFSGHAGLFGTAADIFRLASCLMDHYSGQKNDLFSPETVRAFFTRQDIAKGSTWALGWDTPALTNSSSGKYFSPTSIGHLGFTGTSIWMDLEKEIIVILLTNRVHPDRNNIKIREFRPMIHDQIMELILSS